MKKIGIKIRNNNRYKVFVEKMNKLIEKETRKINHKEKKGIEKITKRINR